MIISSKEIAKLIRRRFSANETKKLQVCIEDTIKELYPHMSPFEVAEIAERIKEKVRHYLHEYLFLRASIGSPARFYFSESDPDFLIGYSRALKNGHEKSKFNFIDDIRKAVMNLSSSQFEVLCGGLLFNEGFKVLLTKQNGGADLYAKDKKGNLYLGQAKHTRKEFIPLAHLRELLGTTTDREKYLNLRFNPLLFTTAGISLEGLEFSKRNGIIIFDGEKIAYFIAKYNIGFIKSPEINFNENNFRRWLTSLPIKRVPKNEIKKLIISL